MCHSSCMSQTCLKLALKKGKFRSQLLVTKWLSSFIALVENMALALPLYRKPFTASGFWQERSKMYLDGGRKKINQTSFISVEKIVTISWNWLQLNPPILLRQIWLWRDFTQCLAPILVEANIYCLWLSTNAPNLRKKKNSKLRVPHQECLRLFISKKCFDHQEIPLDCYEKSTFNNCFRNNPLKK